MKLIVSISEQVLYAFDKDNICTSCYAISTSMKGMGEQIDSYQTPRGWHEIYEKIGDDASPNAVFVARKQTGETFSNSLRQAFPSRDWILTRILRLSGLEEGVNRSGDVDSYRRCIYIHGTPDDIQLGIPGSNGCIRMRNNDIITLYDQLSVGDKVLIIEDSCINKYKLLECNF